MPVFHFANNAGLGKFGKSELADVIPLQDALNKSITDMLVAMEYVALPQRWATGLEVDIDPIPGKPRVPFTPGVERIWTVGDENVRFGQFDAANLQQFLGVSNDFRAEIARVSGTPFHYLMLEQGAWPSGEAMKTAEARFLAKVQDRMASFGNSWEDVMRLALRMKGLGEGRLSTQWKDPAPKSEKEHVDSLLVKQQLGVPQEQLWREAGYSDEDIEAMKEQAQAGAGALGENLLKSFETGV